MAEELLDKLRLTLMEDVLPVGMAIFERAKQGGPGKIAEIFTAFDRPLESLRKEGESAAELVRERLDNLSPGLGNPVIPVHVDIDCAENSRDNELDLEDLVQVLNRIDDRLQNLDRLLEDDKGEMSTPSVN